MKKQIVGGIAALALSGGALMGLGAAPASADPAPSCVNIPAVAGVPAVTHTEWQWVTFTLTGPKYKWTTSPQNPTTDIFHVWFPTNGNGKLELHVQQATRTVIDVPEVPAQPAVLANVSYQIPTVTGFGEDGVVNFGAYTCGTWKVGSKVTLTDGSEFQTHGGTSESGPITRYRLVFTPNAGLDLPPVIPGDGFKVGNSAVFHVYLHTLTGSGSAETTTYFDSTSVHHSFNVNYVCLPNDDAAFTFTSGNGDSGSGVAEKDGDFTLNGVRGGYDYHYTGTYGAGGAWTSASATAGSGSETYHFGTDGTTGGDRGSVVGSFSGVPNC